MSSQKNSRLWNQGVGIRFAMRLDPRPLYPQMNFSRFLHGFGAQSHDTEGLISPLANPDHIKAGTSDVTGSLDAQPPHPASPNAELNAKAELEVRSAAQAEQEARQEPIDPPWTDTGYNIPYDIFHAARVCPPGAAESYWSHTMYRGIGEDGTQQRVKVHYCTSKHSMEQVCEKHFLGHDLLGFDLEWVASARRTDGPLKNVSLIQLATESRIGLFHVSLFKKGDDLIGPIFRKIMEDSTVTKVGVCILADCTRLQHFLGVPTRGIFELSHLYKLVKHSRDGRLNLINRSTVNLGTQVQEVLQLPLFKGASVRTSDWMKPLNERQLLYSAADAYAGVQLFHVLEDKRKQLKPCPPRPHHAELGLPIQVAEPEPVDPPEEIADEAVVQELLQDALVGSELEDDLSKTNNVEVRNQPEPKPDMRDARVSAAQQKAKQYRASKGSKTSSAPSALSAYYIWHENDELDPEAVAKLLRDPPLQTHTVVTYILNAVLAEKLPYSKLKMRNVLSHLNPQVLGEPKYQVLVSACQGAGQQDRR